MRCTHRQCFFELHSRDESSDNMKIKYARRKSLPRKTKTVKRAELVITKTESTLKLDVDKEDDTGQRPANALGLNVDVKEEPEVLAISEQQQQHLSTAASWNDSDTITSEAAQSAEINGNDIKQESASEQPSDITSALVKKEPESTAEKESGSPVQEEGEDAENNLNTDGEEDGEGRLSFS